MPSVRHKRSHGDIYVYLELCKQKRRADDELNSPAFLTVLVIPNKSGRLLVSVIEGGGGALASINNR